MKKYKNVKVISEENEEEIKSEDIGEIENDFFTKDQKNNERRRRIRKKKLKTLKEGGIINFKKIFKAIGWGNEQEIPKDSNEIKNELAFSNDESENEEEEEEEKGQNELEIFSDDENFMESGNKNKKNYFDESIIFQDNYSFRQTYINLIKQMKGDKITLSSKLKKKLTFNLEINVGDFIVSEGLIFNYVNYELEGKIKKKDFELYRRYSEFAVYRKLLRKNWPGIFIPFLPPKKTYGNLDDTFIIMRRKFLQIKYAVVLI